MTKRRIAKIEEIEHQQMLLGRYTVAQFKNGDKLDRSVYLLLSRIHAQGPMSIAELSQAFHRDVSTLQRQTTVAIHDGLLERTIDPTGSIARKFILTPLGEARLKDVRDHAVKSLENVMAAWSDEDVTTFAELLHRFNASIEDYRETKAN